MSVHIDELTEADLAGSGTARTALRDLTQSADPVESAQAVAALAEIGARERLGGILLRTSGGLVQAAAQVDPSLATRARNAGILVALLAVALVVVLVRKGR